MHSAPRARATLAARALALLAFALLAGMLWGALHDASQAWDVGYYHWPFAARLAGIVGADDLVFHDANQARFDGFPLLGELLQGALWRLTGRAECTNLVAWGTVPLVAWFARRRFGVPWGLTVVALLAVPLVHTHATASYVDLPANAALAVLVLLAFDAWSEIAAPSRGDVALALACAAAAANTKALLHPLVALALAAIFARLLRERARTWPPRALAVVALALPLVFATPLKNLARHGNPYYPVRLTVAGHVLPGPESSYSSSPDWLARAPRPVRFACSLAEAGLRPMSDPRRWTIDQWAPADDPGLRMGGFFHAYVALHLAALGWRAWRERAREVRVWAGGFAVFTAAVSVMPQSHELRYYMGWMIALVLVNARLAVRGGEEGARSLRALGAIAVAALAVVLAVTRGEYAHPTGSTFAELVARKVDARALDALEDGAGVCVSREPWNILWAAPFHAPRRYVVKDAETDEDCRGWRVLE
jgi:hypothetical protein